nr:MAG TPA: hypothetical protein [Caudoviricetes sp.]
MRFKGPPARWHSGNVLRINFLTENTRFSLSSLFCEF